MIDSKNSVATPMWYAVSDPMPVPDTSMLPPTDKPTMASEEMMQRVAQGARSTIDRVADSVAPTVRQSSDHFAGVEDALREKTDQILETRDHWSETVRVAVRKNPLVFLSGALVVGALIARLTR